MEFVEPLPLFPEGYLAVDVGLIQGTTCLSSKHFHALEVTNIAPNRPQYPLLHGTRLNFTLI